MGSLCDNLRMKLEHLNLSKNQFWYSNAAGENTVQNLVMYSKNLK